MFEAVKPPLMMGQRAWADTVKARIIAGGAYKASYRVSIYGMLNHHW
jgi:hypothetical protein